MQTTEQQPQSAAKDFFAYLLLFVLLYTWVTGLGRLLFGYINVAFPEFVPGLASRAVTFDNESRLIKLQFSILLITFPVFVFLYRWILGELARGVMRWESRVRKWLTYLTLFVAALTVIVDIATRLYYFLSGEFTVRFILKVVTVFLLGGAAFYYFMKDARDAEENARVRARPFAMALGIVVVISLVASFFIIDAPWVERAKRFDRQRINDLGSITYAVQSFYEQRGVLPARLTDLREQGSWSVSSLIDPQTGASYEYRVTGATDYELCATFRRSGNGEEQPGVYPARPMPLEIEKGILPFADRMSSQFQHGAGRQCFDRKVYPRVK